MRLGAVLFISCFFFTTSLSEASQRIVNGKPASPKNWPALGAIVDSNYAPADEDGQFCSGALIAPQIVLTAGHCLESINLKTTDVIFKRKDLRFQTGIRRAVVKKIIHQRFNSKTNNYDLGLLYLNQPIKNIQPLPIRSFLPKPGALLKIAGWGLDGYPNGNRTNRLQETSVQLKSRKVCQRSYLKITKQSFCAGTNRGDDACLGDSGSPALFKGKIVGVVSRGRGCGNPLFPGVYSRVDLVKNWLNYYIHNQLISVKNRLPKKEKPYKLFFDQPYKEIYLADIGKYQFNFYLYLKEPARSVKIYSDRSEPICIVNGSCLTGWIDFNFLTGINGYTYALFGLIEDQCLNTYYQIDFRDKRFKKIKNKLKICSS